jgi:hypothetical protein
MSTKSQLATVEQSAPSKVPLLHSSNISPAVMREYVDACRAYFNQKNIAPDMQVRMIVPGIKDYCIRDWITADRERIYALEFDKFIIEFCQGYLADDWEGKTRRELLAMTQGNQSFWNFQVAVKAKNSLLYGTDSYLTEDKLHHRIEVTLEPILAQKCDNKKVQKVIGFREWLTEVKRMDDILRAE